jgi:acyl-CoA synthetase (AMP-forming)/AMP-acid ligase II
MELIDQQRSLQRLSSRLISSIQSDFYITAVKPICTLTSVGTEPFSSNKDSKVIIYSRNDIAVLTSTHGTTETTKLVPLTHGNILSSIESISTAFRLTAADSTYLIMPLYHTHGLVGVLLSSFFVGATVLLPFEMEINNFWSDVVRFKVQSS